MVFLFVLSFIGLVIGIFVLKQQNTELKQKLFRNEKQFQVLNSEPIEYKGPGSQSKKTQDEVKTTVMTGFTPVDSTLISVQDLQVLRVDENNLSVTFKLKNTGTSSAPLQGYLVVGAFPEPLRPEAGILFPQAVKTGKDFTIENITAGDPFSIKYLKNITVTIFSSTPSQLQNLVIFVYAKNGNIIYRKAEKIDEK
ncbi:MAG TPA: hypothetical protein PLP19_04200 [bacterium]|nr:hypothetical protein [bacterium]HPN42671.1 hypothetical protein [bacterium]